MKSPFVTNKEHFIPYIFLQYLKASERDIFDAD